MSGAPKAADPYGLAPAFEAQAVTAACAQPRFYGRLGHALDPDCLGAAPAKLALQAAHAIARDLGHGPSTPLHVLQRLRRWVAEGKVTLEQVRGVGDMFDAAEDDPQQVGEEALVAELAPLLAKRIRADAVRAGISEIARAGDLSGLVAAEARAAALGVVDTSIGVELGDASFAEIQALGSLERLPTGIPELDAELEGGLQRAGLGVVIGGSGDGKSIFMTHVSAYGLLSGCFVACATLELPPALQLARVKAAATGIPTNAIIQSPQAANSCRVALAARRAAGTLGRYVVQEFTPEVTTVQDVRAWVASVEERAERAVDLLVVDYADKMVAPRPVRAGGGRDESDYVRGRVVFEGLRTWAVERNLFVWTGSQSRRRDARGRKVLDLDDVADSMHKVRVADLVITLNRDEEEGMRIKVGKHRTAAGGGIVGPIPTDFTCGRLTMVSW